MSEYIGPTLTLNINSPEMDSYFARLQAFLNLDDLFEALEFSGRAVGQQIVSYTKAYPPYKVVPRPLYYTRYDEKGRAYKSKWKTAKQEGWFWNALHSGELELPYKQTGQAGASMTVEVVRLTGPEPAVEAKVGALEPYAVYLFGLERGPGDYQEGMQSAYHRDKGWKSFEVMIKENTAELELVWADALREYLDRNRSTGAYYA